MRFLDKLDKFAYLFQNEKATEYSIYVVKFIDMHCARLYNET